MSCFELCFQYRRHTRCRGIHAACFLNLHTKDRPEFSRDHSIGQPNMIQRDRSIRGVTLGRLLGISFPSSHSGYSCFVWECCCGLKQHFSGSTHLCHLYIMLWCSTGPVGLLSCRNCFADYWLCSSSSCKYSSWECGLRTNMCLCSEALTCRQPSHFQWHCLTIWVSRWATGLRERFVVLTAHCV